MKFVDSCEVTVRGGMGGNGCVAFRREKFVPFGGPSGGDGGRGGDVVLVTGAGLSSLLDLVYVRALEGEAGENGQGKDCYGRGGRERECRVPVGTQVFDKATGALLFDLTEPDMRVVVAKGGKGGRGNIHFSTPYDRAPRRSEPGEPGEERVLRLELKVMADVGLLGYPNVGKSTFISAVSRARPKVADYPFTTLTPSLGVVRIDDQAHFVVADIPGLIEGAAEGAGLGHRFLKHVERTRALLHIVTLDPDESRNPLKDYETLKKELAKYDPELAKRPTIVVMSKGDLTEVAEAFEGVKKQFAKKGVDLRLISAATGLGMKELTADLFKLVQEARREAEEAKLAAAKPKKVSSFIQTAPAVAPAEAEADSPDASEPEADEAPDAETPAPSPKKQATPATKKPAASAKKAAKKTAAANKPAKKKKATPAVTKTAKKAAKKSPAPKKSSKKRPAPLEKKKRPAPKKSPAAKKAIAKKAAKSKKAAVHKKSKHAKSKVAAAKKKAKRSS
ncbi:MAG: GTPase ObgE [Polyangiaceae bacterium]